MPLYSTDLLMGSHLISYQVYREGDRLFFKPTLSSSEANAPIFWVVKTGGEWKPMNIQDENFIKQVQQDILKHYLDKEELN